METFALSAEVWTGQLWRLWTGHFVHWSARHLLLNLAAFAPVAVAMRGDMLRILRWMLISAPLISIALLLTTPTIEYRGASAVILGAWLVAGNALIQQRERRGAGWALIALALAKLTLETLGAFPTSLEIDSSLLAHWCGALCAMAFVWRSGLQVAGCKLQVVGPSQSGLTASRSDRWTLAPGEERSDAAPG